MSIEVNKTDRIVNVTVIKKFGKDGTDGKSIEADIDIANQRVGFKQEGEANFEYIDLPSVSISQNNSNTLLFDNINGTIHGTWDNPITGVLEVDLTNALNGASVAVIWSGSSLPSPLINGGYLQNTTGEATTEGIYTIYINYLLDRFNINVFNSSAEPSTLLNNLLSVIELEETDKNGATDTLNNHNFTLNQPTGISVNQTGIYGKAYSIDSYDSYLSNTSLALALAGKPSASVSLWLKTTYSESATYGSFPFMVGKNTSGKFGFGLGLYDGQIRAIIANKDHESAYYQIQTSSTYNDNQWHHIVVIQDGSNSLGYLYIDKNLIGSFNTNTALHSSLDLAQIGGAPYVGRSQLGLIDQVTIWDKALTSEEVTELYDTPNYSNWL